MPMFLALTTLLLTGDTLRWTHLGRDAAHSAAATHGPRTLDHIRWTAVPDPNENFIPLASPVVADGRVIVVARRLAQSSHVGNRVIAFAADDGARLWDADLPPNTLDSWSSPTIDAPRNTVLVTSGAGLFALDAKTGTALWDTPLRRSVINASPVVTDDLTSAGQPADRVLLTDYDGAGSAASLYCINVSPFDAVANPFAPGQIAWRLPLGRASGATPAYADGRVYVAHGAGRVLAVDVLAPPLDPNDANRPLPAWDVTVATARTPNEGFFGGISLADGRLLAAQYEFYSGANSARLFALAADDGHVHWQAPCERTSSIPLPWQNDVLLAGGVVGFGSEPKLQAYAADANSATPRWEVRAATGTTVGGYAHQPARLGDLVYVGMPPTAQFFGPYTDLYILDAAREPNDPAFVVDHHSGAGGSPALAYGRLFSLGTAGLVAFDPSDACAADADASGRVDVSDLARLLAAFGAVRGDATFDDTADVDLSGSVGLADLASLLAVFGEDCE